MKYQAIRISQRTGQVKRIYSGLTVPQMADPYHPTKYKPFGTGDRPITLGYLRVFMERGGMALQVNVVDRKILLDAEENPKAYRDILVRVGGYSDYFTRLSPALRKEIIERTEC